MFNAIVVDKDSTSGHSASLKELDEAQLAVGDVTVRIEYSTLNYKDGLAITGDGPVVRSFPMVPGIDFAGVVESSDHSDFKGGDHVVLNGWGVGEAHWGGLSQRARVKSQWLIHLPEGFSAREAMAIGTAGYTAMLCVMALEKQGLQPASGPVLVTGANGGVGSYCVALLAKLGHQVVASTRRLNESDYLRRLGATDVVDGREFAAPGKPLQKERWTAAVDTVGSHTLANVCAQIRYGGAVAACGMAQGLDLPASVAPFILRGVSLLGVDSVMQPRGARKEAWARLARDLEGPMLEEIAQEIPLTKAVSAAHKLMRGEVRGRLIVDTNA